MKKTILAWIGTGLMLVAPAVLAAGRQAAPTQSATASATPATPAAQRAVVDKYCVTCHNQRAKTADLALDTMDLGKVGAHPEVWEKVIRKLRTEAMPPMGAPRPPSETLAGLATYLEQGLDREAAAAPNPGRPIVRRLNRTEYTNAVRDLLALTIDGRALLPTDNAGHGFDNIGDVLTISPALLERYLITAQYVSRLAVGDVKVAPVAETFRVPFTMLQEDRMHNDLPFGSRGGTVFTHYFPADGEYTIRIKMQRPAMSNGVRGEARVNNVDLRLDGSRIKLFTVGGKAQAQGFFDQPVEIDQNMEVRLPIKAGGHQVAVSFQRVAFEMEGIGPAHLPTASYGYANGSNTNVTNGRIEMGVDNVEIAGPFNSAPADATASRQRIFVCRPASVKEEGACAQKIVSTLARRAYRRPVTDAEVKTLLGFYDTERKSSTFDAGIRRVVERVLVAPDFLFRVETDPKGVKPGSAYRVSDLELASRLSFFLWSTIPDDELLNVAAGGKLRSKGVMEQQVKRMLASPKASALVDNFFGQWLFLRNISLVRPDPKAYPEFDESLRTALRTETETFLQAQLKEDRGALELLTANYTFVNERLAKHYGFPNIYGERFRKVTYPDDTRAGILGQGAILTTINAYPHRTSPVKRGQWLLENLLGTPPPPPPPNVPPFPEADGNAQPTTVRARMEQHRRNPQCAVCHNRIDPLGFALENFNAVGGWRTMDANLPIDPSGAFPNGTKFSGPAEFRKLLLSQNRAAFLGTLAEKLMIYSLGRGTESYDMPAIRKVLKDASQNDYRWSSLILGVVMSEPFQMRRAES